MLYNIKEEEKFSAAKLTKSGEDINKIIKKITEDKIKEEQLSSSLSGIDLSDDVKAI